LDALTLHRIHFGFTITYHYLFPQLTMGLALLIVILKTLALRASDPDQRAKYEVSARFWAKIFAINFLLGVVTGMPMEFQFGTNWSEFSRRTGGVIGMPLAMEGVFSFFLESAFLGLFLFGEKRLSRGMHWLSAFLVFIGSWISGFFIIVTNAWMQHPVAYILQPNGIFEVGSFWGLMLNPWAWLEYAHNMCASVVTGSFFMALSSWPPSARSICCRIAPAPTAASSSAWVSSPDASLPSCKSSPPAISTANISPKTSPLPSPLWKASSTPPTAPR
jgi:cytochrome d ubiquinol oxidase subunit I